MQGNRVTLHDVAKRAGVGVSSVSRVMGDYPGTSEEMRSRVLAAASELRYRPNLVAQAIRTQTTKTMGFVLGDISNPLLSEIAAGAEKVLRNAGYSMILTASESDPALDADYVRLLRQRMADGLLLSPASERHRGMIRELEEAQVPVVVLDRKLPRSIGASAVLSDHRRGVSDAVEHLLSLGHRRIAIIVGQAIRPSRERSRALVETMARHGEKGFEVVEGTMSVDHGERATAHLLDSRNPPTAIIAGGNQLLLGALRAIDSRNVKIGRDLSLVGCDQIPVTEHHTPKIAIVQRDMRELGRVGAELLLGRVRDGAPPSEVLRPTHYIARPSVGPPRKG